MWFEDVHTLVERNEITQLWVCFWRVWLKSHLRVHAPNCVLWISLYTSLYLMAFPAEVLTSHLYCQVPTVLWRPGPALPAPWNLPWPLQSSVITIFSEPPATLHLPVWATFCGLYPCRALCLFFFLWFKNRHQAFVSSLQFFARCLMDPFITFVQHAVSNLSRQPTYFKNSM